MEFSLGAFEGLNERSAFGVGETEDYLIEVVPMIYNHRVVMTPKSCLDCYDYGWCFPSLLAAIAALRLWDPVTEREPIGFIKRVGAGDKRAL
jgi:hypothetical protein